MYWGILRWILLTSLSVETFAEAWDVIESYECRWLVEEYHKVLKTGCRIERHALREADRLEPLIALISVIGVRLLQEFMQEKGSKESGATC